MFVLFLGLFCNDSTVSLLSWRLLKLSIIEDIDSVWFGRPVLMFSWICCPLGGAIESFKCNLIFVRTFQSLELASESQSPMESEGGIRMLYEPGPWDPAVGSSKKPILHVGYLEHVLCRALLIPCFLDRNSTNTILHSKRKESSRFPNGKCDSHPGADNGSLVFEVNMPLWRFGRGNSRSTSVQEAERLRSARVTVQGNRLHQQKEGEIPKQ